MILAHQAAGVVASADVMPQSILDAVETCTLRFLRVVCTLLDLLVDHFTIDWNSLKLVHRGSDKPITLVAREVVASSCL